MKKSKKSTVFYCVFSKDTTFLTSNFLTFQLYELSNFKNLKNLSTL